MLVCILYVMLASLVLFLIMQSVGETALNFAAKMGNTEVVKVLLEKGADVNQIDVRLKRCLDYCCGIPLSPSLAFIPPTLRFFPFHLFVYCYPCLYAVLLDDLD